MTLTIRSRAITEGRLREIAGPLSIHGSSLPADRMATVAEVQRRDYSHLVVEGTRGGDGVARYFARIDRGERVPLDVGGGRITTVYYGDEDGDGHNDIIVRLEEGGLLVFLAEETDGVAATRPPEASAADGPGAATAGGSGAGSVPYDDVPPYDPEPVLGTDNTGPSPSLTDEGLQTRAASGAQARNDGQTTLEGI